MAKKQAPKNEVVEVKPEPVKAVTVAPTSVLPSLSGASPKIVAAMSGIKENLESIESFRLPRAKMTPDGIELIEGDDVLKELEGVIIHTKKTNVYYADDYNPNEVTPPTCFSMDSVLPDKSIEKPVHATCKGCPKAEFGTNRMKSGKACRNLKPLYMLLGDDAIMPRQLTITPANLKAANQYLMNLTERAIAYRKVKTKIEAYKENPKDTYMKLKFTLVGKLSEAEIKDVDFLKQNWLPIMENQVIDQGEVDNSATSAVESANGEY